MEAVAERLFHTGDVKAAASLYNNMMLLHPRYVRMARICRVLANPSDVPLPHRYADVIEALLDPALTAEALFGADTSAPAVNKAYQRWTLLLHPDKNPYPSAGEAFARLGALRAWALEDRSCAPAKEPRQPQARTGGWANDKSDTTAGGTRRKTEAEMDVSLKRLRNTQITLKSLRRKNIDDDALPELRMTFRDVRQQRFYTQPPSPLASTVPVVPVSCNVFVDSPRTSASEFSISQAKRSAESQGISLAATQREAPRSPVPVQSSTTRESSSEKVTVEEFMPSLKLADPSASSAQSSTMRESSSEKITAEGSISSLKPSDFSASPVQSSTVKEFSPEKITAEESMSSLKLRDPSASPVQSSTVEELSSEKITAEESVPPLKHFNSSASTQLYVEQCDDKESHVHKKKSRAKGIQPHQRFTPQQPSQTSPSPHCVRSGARGICREPKRPCTTKRVKTDAPGPQLRETPAPESFAEPKLLSSSLTNDGGVPGEAQNVVSSPRNEDNHLSNSAKKSIVDLIQHLESVKANTGRVQLNCDLSFAAYQKEKEQRHQKQDENYEARET